MDRRRYVRRWDIECALNGRGDLGAESPGHLREVLLPSPGVAAG